MKGLSKGTLVVGLALLAPSLAAAQLGVSAGDSTRLQAARESGQNIRITGDARARYVPPVYVVRQGDTLWDVTGHFFGNPWEWPRVWSYNPEITNPHWIYPQDRLRLVDPGRAEVTPASSEERPRTTRSQSSRRSPESVFLRQQGYLDPDALRQAGVVTGSPDDHMLLSPFDHIYIEFNEETEGEPSGEHTIFREIRAGDREREPNEQGTLVRIYGSARILSYDRERRVARAQITEALDPIERGFRVAPIPRRFEMVEPSVSDRDLESRVVATLRPQQLVGTQQIVFVPVGREDGVRLGNRFFVVRISDRWQESLRFRTSSAGPSVPTPRRRPTELPTEVVAEARVVDVRDNSATLMVTRALYEVEIGDRVELRRGY